MKLECGCEVIKVSYHSIVLSYHSIVLFIPFMQCLRYQFFVYVGPKTIGSGLDEAWEWPGVASGRLASSSGHSGTVAWFGICI